MQKLSLAVSELAVVQFIGIQANNYLDNVTTICILHNVSESIPNSLLLRKFTSEGVESSTSNDFISKFLKEQGLDKLPERTLAWTVSTEARDRDNDRIMQSGWDLKAYLKNPVVMWSHDYSLPPIGRSIATWIEGVDKTKGRNSPAPRLRMLKQFTSQDENPDGFKIFKLAEAGFIKTASVGFIPREAEPDPEFKVGENEEAPFLTPLLFRKQELLESSVVSIPSNPEALQSAKSVCGVDPNFLKPSIEQLLDEANYIYASRKHLEDVYRVFSKFYMPTSSTIIALEDLSEATQKELNDKINESREEDCTEELDEILEAIDNSSDELLPLDELTQDFEGYDECPSDEPEPEVVSAAAEPQPELDNFVEFELDDLSQALASVFGSGEAEQRFINEIEGRRPR